MLKVHDTAGATEAHDEGPTLDALAREGARRMLRKALAVEVAQYIEAHDEDRDEQGRRLVVRNGQAQVRKVTCVRRLRMSAREQAELWKRWKRGESLSDIGRALGRIPGAVHHVVSARGGILRQIGSRLRRAPSTISREVRRHGGRRRYRAAVADTCAWDRGNHVGWPAHRRYAPWWPRSWRLTGRRSRSRGGSHRPFRRILGCTCRTRRST